MHSCSYAYVNISVENILGSVIALSKGMRI